MSGSQIHQRLLTQALCWRICSRERHTDLSFASSGHGVDCHLPLPFSLLAITTVSTKQKMGPPCWGWMRKHQTALRRKEVESVAWYWTLIPFQRHRLCLGIVFLEYCLCAAQSPLTEMNRAVSVSQDGCSTEKQIQKCLGSCPFSCRHTAKRNWRKGQAEAGEERKAIGATWHREKGCHTQIAHKLLRYGG